GAAPSTRPLVTIQRRLDRAYRAALAAYETALQAWEATPKSARGPKPPTPRYEHVLSTDPTSEALVPMLRDAKGILLFRDELVAWVKSMDQYRGGKGADRQNFLSAWSRG